MDSDLQRLERFLPIDGPPSPRNGRGAEGTVQFLSQLEALEQLWYLAVWVFELQNLARELEGRWSGSTLARRSTGVGTEEGRSESCGIVE